VPGPQRRALIARIPKGAPLSGVEPASRTQEQRRTEAERRLLEAAAELIGEVGPSRVTLANVGERAGYSRGLATHHFGSKGALMQRVADIVTERFRETLTDRDRPESPTDELLRLVRTYIDVVSDLPPMNRARLVLMADAVATASPDVRPAMVAADRAFRESIARSIQRGVTAGEFPRSVHPVGLATVIVGMLRGVTFQSMIDDQVDLEASGTEIERLLIERLRPSPAIPLEGANR
jgi:AcrR family transcriptional regulator